MVVRCIHIYFVDITLSPVLFPLAGYLSFGYMKESTSVFCSFREYNIRCCAGFLISCILTLLSSTMDPVEQKPNQHPLMTPIRELSFFQNRNQILDLDKNNLLKFAVWRESIISIRRYIIDGESQPFQFYCLHCGKNKCSCPLDK